MSRHAENVKMVGKLAVVAFGMFAFGYAVVRQIWNQHQQFLEFLLYFIALFVELADVLLQDDSFFLGLISFSLFAGFEKLSNFFR